MDTDQSAAEELQGQATHAAGSDAPDEDTKEVAPEVAVQAPEFAALSDSGRREENPRLDRFLDVSVTLSAELGRVSIPIGELLELGGGVRAETGAVRVRTSGSGGTGSAIGTRRGCRCQRLLRNSHQGNRVDA